MNFFTFEKLAHIRREHVAREMRTARMTRQGREGSLSPGARAALLTTARAAVLIGCASAIAAIALRGLTTAWPAVA